MAGDKPVSALPTEPWSHVPNVESFLQDLYTRADMSAEPTSAQFSALSARVATNSVVSVDLSPLSQAISVLSQQISSLSQVVSVMSQALSNEISNRISAVSNISVLGFPLRLSAGTSLGISIWTDGATLDVIETRGTAEDLYVRAGGVLYLGDIAGNTNIRVPNTAGSGTMRFRFPTADWFFQADRIRIEHASAALTFGVADDVVIERAGLSALHISAASTLIAGTLVAGNSVVITGAVISAQYLDLASVQSNIVAISATLASVQSNVAAISATQASVQSNVAAVSATLASVQSNVGAISATLASVISQVSLISLNVAANSATLTSVQSQISLMSQGISVLSQQVSVMSQFLSVRDAALSVRIDTQSQTISVLSQQISVLSQQVSAMSQRLSALSVIAGGLSVVGDVVVGGVVSVTGGDINEKRTTAGGNVALQVWNVDNTNPASNATVTPIVGGAAAGDPVVLWQIAGTITWAMGLDNSDSDMFKIAKNATLGTNDYFLISADGNVAIPNALSVGGGVNISGALSVKGNANITGIMGLASALSVGGTLRVDNQASTGTNIPTIGTNKPGSAVTLTPNKWLTINLDGTTHYIPCWI